MAEFGEQLRKAREVKGMTQQSLAEKLYVTRQAVSRWECGDRYPDLITAKRIAQILDVSLDDLISEKDMKQVAERNPIVEKPSINNIVIAQFAFVLFACIVSTVNMFIRNPLDLLPASYDDLLIIGTNLLSKIIQAGIFAFGLIMAVKGMLSPKMTVECRSDLDICEGSILYMVFGHNGIACLQPRIHFTAEKAIEKCKINRGKHLRSQQPGNTVSAWNNKTEDILAGWT
mgnify:CR=1 FL=1